MPESMRAATVLAILTRAGKLTSDDADKITRRLPGSNLARALDQSRLVSDHDYRLACAAASLADNDTMSLDLMLSGFEFASRKGITLNEGLRYFGWSL